MKSSVAAGEVRTSPALLTFGAESVPDVANRQPEDQDTGDVPTGIDEDALNEDDLDTDQITSSEA